MKRPSPPQPGRQRGIAAVEFALTSVILFTFLFGILEVARVSFVWSTLAQATSSAARGAATAPFLVDGKANPKLDAVRQQAIFASNATDAMTMMQNITYQNLLVDYLNAKQNHVGDVPICQAENLMRCAADPDSSTSSCVRFVRVRVCEAGGDGESCTPVQYHPLVLMSTMQGLHVAMPPFTAIVPMEANTIPGLCP